MIHLLAYLLVRRGDGTWSVTSHRNLEGLTLNWREALESDKKASALVHVGFWRPDVSLFEIVCSDNEGRVLLTEAAKIALPQTYMSAVHPCAIVDNLPIYLALSGWGYEVEEAPDSHAALATNPKTRAMVPSETPTEPVGWLGDLQHDSPDLFAKCSRFSILSEALYLERESLLPSSARNRLGMYRFKALSGHAPSSENLLDRLACAPPWFLQLLPNPTKMTGKSHFK
jgi:hypothetical protein